MTAELDCRGLACPAPVLQTKEVIERDHPETIRVTVDNPAARENVSRFLRSRGFEVSSGSAGGEHFIFGKRADEAQRPPCAAERESSGPQKIMVVVAADRLGRGDDLLGKKLLFNFLKTLKEMGSDLWRLVFLNGGVQLTVEGSEALPVLREYEEGGLRILVCGACLTHFGLLEQKKVGETTNMLDIVTAMQVAGKVIQV
jgi:selenium metabolism protein YedF